VTANNSSDQRQPQRQVFISDLHLDNPNDVRFDSFAALLAAESRAGAQIFILGDLCEVWVGDDDDGELAQALRDTIADAAEHSSVSLLHGNRDFLFGEQFAKDTGSRMLPDPYVLDNNLLLSHGDMFCLDDEAYQQARTMLRSAQWQADVLAQDLTARRALAQGMRAQSQASNANKAANIMDVRTSEITKVAAEHGCPLVLHGHTHRPGLHQDDGVARCVLGDWEHCGWLAVREDPQAIPQLVRFALTGRYESVAVHPLQ